MHVVALKTLAAGLMVLCLARPASALEVVEDRFDLYGYFDATMGENRYDSDTWGFDAYHWVMIFDWDVSDFIGVFGDVTFEHGPMHTSRNIGDIKTRSYVQLRLHDAVMFNVGKFLAPFGSQNLVHDATPTYFSVNSPRSVYWKRQIGVDADGNPVTGRLFAKEVAGAWMLGTFPIAGNLWLKYDAYLVNGRSGPNSNPFKIDDNGSLGFGGKLLLHMPYDFAVGGSYYNERHGGLSDDARIQSWSAQVDYIPGNLAVSGEVMGGIIQGHASLPRATPLAYYAQVGYRILERYTPYARWDSYENPTYDEQEHIFTGGLNVMLTPRAYLKGEYGYYEDGDDVLQFQVAVAY